MFKSPIEWLKEAIQELIHDFANVAFDWISIFMLSPTDFSKYNKIGILYDFVFSFATSLCVVFVSWGIISSIFSAAAGVESRGLAEIFWKAFLSFALAASAPWIITEVLLAMNNQAVQYFLDRGLDTKALETFAILPGTSSLTMFLAALAIVGLFLLLAMQYIQRLGEYIVLVATSPIAAQSIVTEEFNVWPVWWREIISVIFSQAFQVALLWLVLNLLTGTDELEDYLYAIGLMVVILKGPRYLRQFFYSTGAGRTLVGMAGGAGKMTMYKYMASIITKR